jgi:hypothetical protein
MSVENYGGMMSTGKNAYSSTRALCQSYQQSSSNKAGGTGEVIDEFYLTKYLCSYFEGVFNVS